MFPLAMPFLMWGIILICVTRSVDGWFSSLETTSNCEINYQFNQTGKFRFISSIMFVFSLLSQADEGVLGLFFMPRCIKF